MSISDRKMRQREELHNAILEAAWEIVVQEGWQALSVRKIANAIDYSVPVIYDHFENKEAILRSFTLDGFNRLNQVLKTAVDSVADPAKQIEAIGSAYWKFSMQNKEYYQIMYGLGMPSCEDVQKTDELKEFSKIVSTPISLLIASSGTEKDQTLTKFKTYWSLLHGLVSIDLWNDGSKAGSNEKVLDDFTHVFIAGIRSK